MAIGYGGREVWVDRGTLQVMDSVDCHLPGFATKWIASWSDKPQFVDLKVGAKTGNIANVTGA